MNNKTKFLSQIIRERRSIFPTNYSNEPVPDAIIHEMLENANWAPTHKNTEPWRFIVFKGEGLKKLADFQSELYKRKATESGTFSNAKFDTLSKKPLKASHILSIGMVRDKSERIPEVEEIEAVACAVQNMMLTASAHGVGCYWGSGGITYLDEAKSFFDLGPTDRLLGFLYVGMPKSRWPSGRRKSIKEKVQWVGK